MRIKDKNSDLYLYITSKGKFIDSKLTEKFIKFLKLNINLLNFQNEVFLNKNNKKKFIEKMDFFLNSEKKDLVYFEYKEKGFYYNIKTNKSLNYSKKLNKNYKIPNYIIEKVKYFLKEINLSLYDIKEDKIIINAYTKFYLFFYNNSKYVLFNNKNIKKELNLNNFKIIKNLITYNNEKYSVIKDLDKDNLILLKENQEPIILHTKSNFIKNEKEIHISKGTSFLLFGNIIKKIINHTELNLQYYGNIDERKIKFSIIPNINNNIFFLNNEIYMVSRNFHLFDEKDLKQTYKNLTNNIEKVKKENNKCVFKNNF